MSPSPGYRGYGTDREQSAAEERLFYAREREEQTRALKRHAERYLEEHCDRRGRLMPSGLSVREVAMELGIDHPTLTAAVTAERRRRGMPVRGDGWGLGTKGVARAQSA